MCGLVGVAGNINTVSIKNAFYQLLQVDVIRGPHATGVAAVNNNKDVVVVKGAVLPPDLEGLGDVLKKFNLRVLIGHNRWATMGAANDPKGAHPFEFNNVVGAHNGTLRGWWENELKAPKDCKIDSEAIYNALNQRDMPEVYNKLDGAVALSWYSKDDNLLEFIRNEDRPLHYCFTEDKKTLFWASEVWMLIAILARNKIKHEKVREFKAHHHYYIDVSEVGKELAFENRKKLKPYEPPAWYKQYGGRQQSNFIPLIPKPLIAKIIGPMKTNIHGFGKGKGVNKYNPQRMSFYLDGVKTDNANRSYYSGETLRSNDKREVRMYAHFRKGSKLGPMPINFINLQRYFAPSVCFGNLFVKSSEDNILIVVPSTLELVSWESETLVDEKGRHYVDYSNVEGQPLIKNKGSVVVLHQGFNNEMLTKEAFDQRVSVCGHCDNTVEFEDCDDLFWFDRDTAICKKCIIQDYTDEKKKGHVHVS